MGLGLWRRLRIARRAGATESGAAVPLGASGGVSQYRAAFPPPGLGP